MLKQEDFYKDYDNTIEKVCKNYYKMLEIGALAVSSETRDILDLGIGTANFSRVVRKLHPEVKVVGVDYNDSFVKQAKEKIPDATIYIRDIFAAQLPEADYVISSLTTHHFDNETRRSKLTEIARSAKFGFINFDMFLIDKNSLDDVIRSICDYVAITDQSEETRMNVEHELRTKDNPMSLDEQKELFEGLGMKFRILAKEHPYAVYHASWN